MKNELKVFSGNGNPQLAEAICEYLRLPLGQWRLNRFMDGEVYCQVLENVRGSQYVRVRGTNGNELEPALDHQGEDPFSDLWFYSNPIFVTPRFQ